MQLPRVRTWIALAAWGVVPAVATSTGCRTATQIIVDVESDQCARIQSTDVTVATDELTLATKTISDASRVGCVSPPQVGRVVLVPDGADDKEIVIRIVSGLDKPASTCREGDEGCIVARRRARFVPNEIVRVSVSMSLTCQRVVCSAGESCDPLTGKCVDIEAAGAPSSRDAGVDAPAPLVDAGACNAEGCVFECNSPKVCKAPGCQPGLPCTINCNTPDACDGVSCGLASSCQINCNVDDACKGPSGIQCEGAATCNIACNTNRACATDIRCTCNALAPNASCTVTCGAPGGCSERRVNCCAVRRNSCHYPDDFKCEGQCD